MPTLFALIIGIDCYLKLRHLAGAVLDANKISEFLINDLGTPPSHITDLRNDQATRAEIIRAIQVLQSDDRIKPGDPILIYFAGHGGVTDASEEWKARHKGASKIQVIFPYDYDEMCNGVKVNCIPDKTIAYLLNELAATKGDNITVIFDSCHSASGSWSLGAPSDWCARSADPSPGIPADIDDNTIGKVVSVGSTSRHTESPFCTHQNSHIHLAACSSTEYAWERSGRGEFTAALLGAIRDKGVDKVTYHNLIQGLPRLTQQTPHCYGAHKSRILFNGRVSPQQVAYIPVSCDPDPKNVTLTLHAGVSSGVAHKSVWELRTSPTLGNEGIVGTAMVNFPGASETKLSIWKEKGDAFRGICESAPFKGGKIKLYARLLESGPRAQLKVWFSPEAKKLVAPEPQGGGLEATNMEAPEFTYVPYPVQDGADMVVGIYRPTGYSFESTTSPPDGLNADSEVEFRLCNPTAERYGVATLRQRRPARRDDVEMILFAAAKWHWYLNQTNPECPRNLVTMEIFKIGEKSWVDGEYSDTQRRPVPSEDWVNLNKDQADVVDFYTHEKDLYGIRLRSEVDRYLYVRMFYFDTTTFSIVHQFGHTGANGREDPDLRPLGEFIIGDDADGGTPLPFRLYAGEVLDVGFLKVFWSTNPLELGNVEQGSAFEMEGGRHVGTVQPLQRETVWGTTTLVLVQRNPVREDAS